MGFALELGRPTPMTIASCKEVDERGIMDIYDLLYTSTTLYEDFMEALKKVADVISECAYEMASAISEALCSYGVSIEEFAESISSIIRAHNKSKILSPRQYGLSLQGKWPHRIPKYPYIPITPRDLPYQRRSYW